MRGRDLEAWKKDMEFWVGLAGAGPIFVLQGAHLKEETKG